VGLIAKVISRSVINELSYNLIVQIKRVLKKKSGNYVHLLIYK